ncbi:hypothetical protein N9936_01340, partial [bacterium]|nr:hypothetical protein [bacterium]
MTAKHLHIDIETYSSVDIKKSGAYAYAESPDFEILILAYAFDAEEVRVVDLAMGEEYPAEFLEALTDPTVLKYAHNAAFERVCFAAVGLVTEIEQWFCTAILSSYAGLPLGLDDVSKALGFTDKAKLKTGKDLIRYFSSPQKPKKANGFKHRNLPSDDPEKWELYKEYCKQDVVAERAICERLKAYTIPELERRHYFLDQKINDRGIKLHLGLAEIASRTYSTYSEQLKEQIREITGLAKSSDAEIKKWLSEQLG